MRRIPAGNFVLIEGIDQLISKTATVVNATNEDADILVPIKFWTSPVIKVAI